MNPKRITQDVFYKELRDREITEYDFINYIENSYRTILNIRDFKIDFERKGYLTAPKEALFKMFLEKHDEKAKMLRLRKTLKEVVVVATTLA